MIRKIGLLISLCALALVSFSQRVLTREEYIQKYRTLAVHEMQRCGIPASIKLAQACLESGNGNSELSQKSNNHFGIKCKSNWTGKRVFHDDDMRNECFRHYNSVEESFIDHSNFLIANPRYSGLFQLEITDYKGWARGLKKAGYATAPHYAESLIKIIEDYKLYVYDHVVDGQQIDMISTDSSPKQPAKNLINPYQTRKVVFRNGLKSIVVKSGDTPQSIVNEFDMKMWELYKYNDLPEEHRIKVNEILYIVPKRNKALRSFKTHVFQSDDTMHYLSQRYGIRLKKLYRLNRMRYGERPVAGTVIYLRDKKPR
ncbi:glucosaminidase domain-containing protein [Mangrovibacterium lignilyticum]|uniref:glucosaminidase domain-containing protein n=1 Tax=Mangrovibacterium lignilyticum TaxID=2668052 RepID=UPI0013D6C750|nr:glucosaminidase domain-containing protein [Mangrovibacterium lignilyticum]